VNILEIRAELEEEQTWRQDEIRFLRNQLVNIGDEFKKMQFRRAIVVMLYAHYEGFCKFALIQYIKAINQSSLKCNELISEIVASAWSKVFAAIENGDPESRIFRRELPNDKRLRRFARRRDFLDQFIEFTSEIAQIPEELVDTEANLWPHIMKRNLYLLGLDCDILSKYDQNIGLLIGRRNNIAHGADRNGFTSEEYNALESVVFEVMDDLTSIIMESIKREKYRR
jgi:hypothetical protein